MITGTCRSRCDPAVTAASVKLKKPSTWQHDVQHQPPGVAAALPAKDRILTIPYEFRVWYNLAAAIFQQFKTGENYALRLFRRRTTRYVITRPDTPLPGSITWAARHTLALVSNTGGGYSFYKDARLRRLTVTVITNAPWIPAGA